MKLKILSVKNKPFQGDDGSEIPYSWVKAERESDGVTIEFGTKDDSHEVGETVELNIEKSEKAGGGFKYREII